MAVKDKKDVEEAEEKKSSQFAIYSETTDVMDKRGG